jgi:hypothetical protein
MTRTMLIALALLLLAALWVWRYGEAWAECVAWGYGGLLCVYKAMLS